MKKSFYVGTFQRYRSCQGGLGHRSFMRGISPKVCMFYILKSLWRVFKKYLFNIFVIKWMRWEETRQQLRHCIEFLPQLIYIFFFMPHNMFNECPLTNHCGIKSKWGICKGTVRPPSSDNNTERDLILYLINYLFNIQIKFYLSHNFIIKVLFLFDFNNLTYNTTQYT